MWILTLRGLLFFLEGMPFIPLSDRTSKTAQGVVDILSFITKSFVIICKGTPDGFPLNDKPNATFFLFARG